MDVSISSTRSMVLKASNLYKKLLVIGVEMNNLNLFYHIEITDNVMEH